MYKLSELRIKDPYRYDYILKELQSTVYRHTQELNIEIYKLNRLIDTATGE